MSIIDGLKFYHAEFGLGGVCAIACNRLTGRPRVIRVGMPDVRHPITVRVGTSDHMAFRDIFQNHEYLMNLPEVPRTIVDAGANVGYASVYFANRWPGARIVAIEPDPANYAQLVENAKPYPQIIPVLAGVTGEPTWLDLKSQPGRREWEIQTVVSATGKTRGMTLEEIMAEHGFDQIDLLKMDIEGAEKEIFERCAGWIDRIGAMMIEIHEDRVPGCMAAVMGTKTHFPVIYDNGGAGMHYMQRKVTARPMMPTVYKGEVLWVRTSRSARA